MSSSRLVLGLLLSSCLALAEPDGGLRAGGRDAGVCVVNPKGRYTVYFERAELLKVITTLSDITCEVVVLGPGIEKAPITISTPRSEGLSPERFYAVFVAAVEANGLKLSEKDGIVRITK